MNPHKRIGIVLTSLLMLGSVVVLAPPAAAHDCEAVNPSASCGNCLRGDHEHYYNIAGVRLLYCKSTSEVEVCQLATHVVLKDGILDRTNLVEINEPIDRDVCSLTTRALA